jgi:UDP-N-acetyl-D-mannosaminuronic acid transferase (WecB/TagA/CpsF family)
MIEEYGHIPDAFLLNPEETEELRTNKRYLTAQATQKIRKLKAQQQTQELLNAAHRVSDGGVPLGKLIREGHQDPMVARVRYEYAALLRELIYQCGYTKDDLLVVNVRDIIGIVEVLEEMK